MKVYDQMSWSEMMIYLGHRNADIFRENNMSYITCLVTGKSIRYVLGTIYHTLVNRKNVTKLEEIETDEKQRLFSIIKDFAPREYTKEDYISACKALYTLEYFLKTVNENNTQIARRP